MKKLIFILFLFCMQLHAQESQHIILITTDGFRWQELYKGLDTAIANNKKFNEGDSTGIYDRYYATTKKESRKKLLPFIWNEIAAKGQLFGNREEGSNMNVDNPYWFSYPGYNEILSGYADTMINSNDYASNPNTTLPEFLNQLSGFKNKVMAFGAWDAFDRILNEKRSGIPVISAFDKLGGIKPTIQEQLINSMKQDSYKPFGEEECLDVFTHYAAMDALQNKHPRFLYISYGETDEWAHAGKYRSYLDAAHQVDAWIAAIWQQVQSDPFYKDKTTLLITTDHGRGDKIKSEWTSHGSRTMGSNEIWMAAIGAGIQPKGVRTEHIQLFQKQISQTIAKLLGVSYQPTHPTGGAINLK
jgi:hypothetical protein